MSKKSNPEKADRDNPQWSQEDAAFPKERINIRLSQEVIAHFKAEGEGWQTRIDAALRQFIRGHSR